MLHQRTKVDRVMEKSQAVMRRIGLQLLQESKNEMAENGTFEKGRSRDLLSLLVRANTSKDIPASQRLSDEDVLARELFLSAHAASLMSIIEVPTFLVAGHEVRPSNFTLNNGTNSLQRLKTTRYVLVEFHYEG
jgi:hypothetical protein